MHVGLFRDTMDGDGPVVINLEDAMSLLAGTHHLATLTADMDRLIAFYQRVFDARVVFDVEEEGLRHGFIELGPITLLHPFQIPGIDVPQGELPIFDRGRIDHFALQASTIEAFRELHRRAVADAVDSGEVNDVGPILQFVVTDPDGLSVEVDCVKPGMTIEGSPSRRADWRTVDLETYTG